MSQILGRLPSVSVTVAADAVIAIERGAVDAVLPLPGIASRILALAPR